MKKYSLILIVLLSSVSYSFACTSCNKQLNESIYNDSFYSNLFISLSSFWVLTILVGVLLVIIAKNYQAYLAMNPLAKKVSPLPLTGTSIILGIGLGGLIDGIVLHQILQWHDLFSNRVSTSDIIGKSINMYWDGIFHAFCFIIILTGVILLWHLCGKENTNRSGKLLSGGMFTGWGLFNLIEGVINHHLLKLHNVVESSIDHSSGNLLFLGFSALLVLIGYVLIRSDRHKVKNILFINHLNF